MATALLLPLGRIRPLGLLRRAGERGSVKGASPPESFANLSEMNGAMIDVRTPDGVCDCYLTKPAGESEHPGVLFIMDVIGMRPRIKEMADRIADQGYVVLAPHIFYRAGAAPLWEVPDLKDQDARNAFFARLGPLREPLTPAAMASDAGAWLDRLAEESRPPFAVTGYCFGGRFAWTVAAEHADRIAAQGGFHTGGMVTDEPDSPHRLAPKVKAEVYWGHADNDQSMTPEQVAALNEAMDDAGITYTTEVYEGAPHGYTMTDMPAYDEAASERHFRALCDLLERTLGA
jgi:carboxymethylenebutenolidase